MSVLDNHEEVILLEEIIKPEFNSFMNSLYKKLFFMWTGGKLERLENLKLNDVRYIVIKIIEGEVGFIVENLKDKVDD